MNILCGLLFVKRKGDHVADLDRALSKLSHRGPDSHGSEYIDETWYLGHRRLKVIDVDSRSDQPMWEPGGRFVIVFNGEIYNHKELAKQHNIETRTSSDTEVLLLLYRKLGSAMLSELNGMFAFVIFDRVNRTYFAARDRLGVKPLYFYEDTNWLIYASELSPILDIVGDLALSEEGMRQYRVLRTFFNGRTAYARIEMFPASFSSSNGKRQRYWALPYGSQTPPDDGELRSLIEDSISIRTIADVPVGSFLSGGIDSSIVAALSSMPDTWSVGFPDMNEFQWGRIVATHIGSHHIELQIDADQFFEALRRLTKLRREPLSVPNEVSLYLLSKRIKERNTVTLSGEGADELFFGYDRIFKWACSCKSFDLRSFATQYCYASPEGDLEIIESVIAPFRDRGSVLDIVAAFFQIGHLHGLLRRLDAATMAASVEARPPFCDYRLVERMAGVSANYRMANNIVKAPLKRIFRNILPREIIDREKVGFPLPLERLFPDDANKQPTARWLDYCEREFMRYGAIS